MLLFQFSKRITKPQFEPNGLAHSFGHISMTIETATTFKSHFMRPPFRERISLKLKINSKYLLSNLVRFSNECSFFVCFFCCCLFFVAVYSNCMCINVGLKWNFRGQFRSTLGIRTIQYEKSIFFFEQMWSCFAHLFPFFNLLF